ncbi:Metal transporter CNNM3 [Bagarius yarrelli]|uniref:Multifunctional fusion protein n=1 Tax=Bagarius yarrelli TaxID=175774 RepID=A0A556U353_BAGYA|nr:Metal transporter CNNM3 [Bagarius yarrelli]
MVVGSTELRILLMILSVSWFGSGVCSQNTSPLVVGLRLEEAADRVYMRDRVLTAARGSSFKLRLFGSYLLNETVNPSIAFAKVIGANDGEDACSVEILRNASAFRVREELEADDGGLILVETEDSNIPEQVNQETHPIFHSLCVFNGQNWHSAGLDRFRVKDPDPPSEWIPTWGLAVIIILALLICSLIRCLNLSLLWLDPLELYVLHSCGTEDERQLAKRLEPIRRRGNFLLCSLLFLCALGHSVLGVIFYRAFGSILPAVFTCAGLIFLVAELLPHIISSVYGFYLAPGLVWLAQSCLIITCPLSCPLGLFLDLALKRDVSTCGVREKVMELIRANVNDPYSEFVKEEFRRGTLRSKTVEDIMTPLKDCFMLPSTAVLDFNTMSEIMQSGYTRVPVYDEERSNIVEILYVKDLALVDPADCTPMTTITKFYNHPLHFVFNDTKLDAMLEEFKKGNSHLAIVQRVNNEGEGDPFYEVLGLVTLEDVIEEIIKSEILDESDGYMNMKVKRPLPALEIPMEPRAAQEEFSLFKLPEGEAKVRTSPQLLLATHRFLSREVEHFCPQRVSEKVLFHLLRHPSVNQEVRFDPNNKMSPEHYLYTRNHPVDYFILLLQGRVEVEIGKEGLKFENGAFTYYGVSALTAPSSVHQSPVSTQRRSPRDTFELGEATSPSSYCPDYTVRALTDLQLIRVTRLQYLNALTASRVSQSPDPPEIKIFPNSQTKLLNEKNFGQVLGENRLRLLLEIREGCVVIIVPKYLCYMEIDCGFDSDLMDFDELDCSDPFAMSGRCDLHHGLRIEVTKEPFSMRSVANVVIALQRLKHIQRVQSTEFTDKDLFNIFMENVIEESVVIDLKCSEAKSYSMQDKVVQCTICDKSKRSLVRRDNLPILLAITLKGANENNKAWFNLSAYNPPRCTENTKGQPICLGIVKTNLFLSCTLQNETPFLGIEEVKDKETLKAIKENDGMERFLFFRNGSGDSLNTFESVKYPGWFISTSKDDFKPSGRCDLHQGLRIEVTKEPFSMRSVANVVIALQRLKHIQRVQSTEFTDKDLFNIFMENVIEENLVINLKCSESKSYSIQDKIVRCTICDKSKRTLVQKEKALLAVTLKGGNEENKAWFNLSAYNPSNCTENTKGQPVCLNIVKTNFFLSSTLQNETPVLGLEEVKDKETLKAIKENDGMERFLFFRIGSGDSLNTFESVKYPGWFISTSKDDFKPVQMSKQQTSHLQLFTLHDETVVLQN